MTLEGADYIKALLIISKQHEMIRKKIIGNLERDGTYLKRRRHVHRRRKTDYLHRCQPAQSGHVERIHLLHRPLNIYHGHG